jgi:ABC-2 type transport system permease protein
MSTRTGYRHLVRFQLRRDRIWLTAWVLGLTLGVVSSAGSVKGLYPDEASLAAAAAVVENNAVVLAFNGPAIAIDTLGGRIVFELGGFGFTMMALMSMFLVGRHTRSEEETGRAELVRAAPVGRDAPALATLITATGANILIGTLIALSLMALGLDASGSFAYGAAMAGVGLVFTGVAAVAMQVTEHARAAYGITGLVIGVAYLLRALGDVSGNGLSWLSPIGWGQAVAAFGDERWWVLVLPVVATGLLLWTASVLTAHRDFGGGLVQPGAGPPRASTFLRHPQGLAFRLHRASLAAWTAGVLLTGISYGAVASDIEDFIGDNEAMADLVVQVGGDITDAFFATALGMMAVMASGFSITTALRPRREELDGRAEALLATALPRHTFLGSHLLVASAGSVVLGLVGGLGTGMANAVATGEPGEVVRLMAAGLAPVPAMWVLVGLTGALVGLVPRAATLIWVALTAFLVIMFFGELLQIPQWLQDLSPFEHVPLVPAVDLEVLPLVTLTVVAVALAGLGMVGLRRRDIL